MLVLVSYHGDEKLRQLTQVNFFAVHERDNDAVTLRVARAGEVSGVAAAGYPVSAFRQLRAVLSFDTGILPPHPATGNWARLSERRNQLDDVLACRL